MSSCSSDELQRLRYISTIASSTEISRRLYRSMMADSNVILPEFRDLRV